ncbi:hypothetical protein BGX38DRAFT_565834 [Terfezia claveryi]|nr:hypothetical protein BGX38DRAFT_565834 [Terfezia claveryi]
MRYHDWRLTGQNARTRGPYGDLPETSCFVDIMTRQQEQRSPVREVAFFFLITRPSITLSVSNTSPTDKPATVIFFPFPSARALRRALGFLTTGTLTGVEGFSSSAFAASTTAETFSFPSSPSALTISTTKTVSFARGPPLSLPSKHFFFIFPFITLPVFSSPVPAFFLPPPLACPFFALLATSSSSLCFLLILYNSATVMYLESSL